MSTITRSGLFLALLSSLYSCTKHDLAIRIDCSKSGLSLVVDSFVDATSCTATDGSVTLTATGGTEPYEYTLGGGTSQTLNVFQNLSGGVYDLVVTDFNGCTASVQVNIKSGNSTLDASTSVVADTDCLSGNGSITVTPSGGTPPYTIKFDAGAFGSLTTKSNLASGSHTVVVKDDDNCTRTLNITVPAGLSNVSYASEISPIIAANCSGSNCHGSGNGSRDFTQFSNVQQHAAEIKSRTGSRNMPPSSSGKSLTDEQIKLISCWVDDGALNN